MMHRMRGLRPPPVMYFVISAMFHYLGPSLAVLLFGHVGVLGAAWLRITSAALVFLLWRGPRRLLAVFRGPGRWTVLALGLVLAAMNCLFYLALDRLPLATVGAIEFLGTVLVAAAGARTPRNLVALALAVGGVVVLTDVRFVASPLGFAFAFANCAGFVLYVVLGHRVAGTGTGIDRLGASMLVAAVLVTPLSTPATITHPWWLLWGIGVGVCSSVIPYVTDQLAMARLPRATFALMLTLLPATATVIGLIVLDQVPTFADLAGIVLVIAGLAVHGDRTRRDGHTDEARSEVQN